MADVTAVASEAIKDGLDKLSELPTPVSSWHVETGRDSADEPAVWVWAMLTDDEVVFAKLDQLRSTIRDRVHDAVGSSTLACIRFRGTSEVERKH